MAKKAGLIQNGQKTGLIKNGQKTGPIQNGQKSWTNLEWPKKLDQFRMVKKAPISPNTPILP